MFSKVIIIIALLFYINGEKLKTPPVKTIESSKHKISSNKSPLLSRTTSTTTELPIIEVPLPIDTPIVLTSDKDGIPYLPPGLVKKWAGQIRDKLFFVEEMVIDRKTLKENFKDIKVETRDGAAIVEKAATDFEDLLKRRVEAVEAIRRQAEKEAANKTQPPMDYIFDSSIKLDERKKIPSKPEIWEIPNNCSSTQRVPLKNLTHFGNGSWVELDMTSVKVAAEVFDCNPSVLQHIYWSERLLHVFQQNYAQDAMTDFQYFCSAKGFMRHYPAARWESMFNLQLPEDEAADVYDCRLRPWYVSAGGAPRDILILFDSSGSMVNSTNKVYAEQFTWTLLNALTDDDQVNVLQFNNEVQSPIACFDEKLVPANYVNSAAIMAALKENYPKNETKIKLVLVEAMKVLHNEYARTDKPRSCQQAIILIADSINENYTEVIHEHDPTGRIRVIVIWLHDLYGLRDNSRVYGKWLACDGDGYFAELVTHADVTEQVMQILRVLERPLVHQRKERLTVFSDVYAHVEDPRRSEFYWSMKERAEQKYRYGELRRNKEKLISKESMYKYDMYQRSLNLDGQYYEGVDLDYRFQISVSVPVFEDTMEENITIVLPEEKQRNATRTYPVNRLLGVAGVDIPLEHLKLILPYYQLGAGGSLFLIDHRGNIVLHENTKPVFDGDILKPGYRTLDFLDLEQSALLHTARNYPPDWLDFRKAIVIDQPRGSRTMYATTVFEGGMRFMLEDREYHWKRVLDSYTVVVSLPKYNRRHAVPDGAFTQQLAMRALKSMSGHHNDISVHPDWLYCKHVDQRFTEPEFEVRHFIDRRRMEPNFKMQNLNHRFAPLRPTLFEKTYTCNEELMVRLCREVVATEHWSDEDQECEGCELGSITAFFASESGLTRWRQYSMVLAHAPPPLGSEWPRGPSEPWYRRAVTMPDHLVIHAPVTPKRKMRRTEEKPPPLKPRDIWLTAARTVEHPEKGLIGVAGYHFHPLHLRDILKVVTYEKDPWPCTNKSCWYRCDGEHWTCVLIDEGGWIVGGYHPDEESLTEEDPAREHLANIHPHAMAALLDAKVFQIHWLYDYQGVCFPLQDPPESSASILPSILKIMWRSINVILHVTREMVTILAFLSSGGLVAGETKLEVEKRRNATRRNYEREKFDRLFDKRVLVNRTFFAACDRSRALYRLQRTRSAMEALKQDPNCSWPLVGAEVPKTNLILLAIYQLCPPQDSRPVNDPFVNQPMNEWDTASALACSRNLVQLPGRAPHSACYPHNYTHEGGYRQCEEWQPDPEVEDIAPTLFATKTICYILALFAIIMNF